MDEQKKLARKAWVSQGRSAVQVDMMRPEEISALAALYEPDGTPVADFKPRVDQIIGEYYAARKATDESTDAQTKETAEEPTDETPQE